MYYVYSISKYTSIKNYNTAFNGNKVLYTLSDAIAECKTYANMKNTLFNFEAKLWASKKESNISRTELIERTLLRNYHNR